MSDCKPCSTCGIIQTEDEFRMKSKPTTTGFISFYRDSQCNTCRKAADRERYQRRLRGETGQPGRPTVYHGNVRNRKAGEPIWHRDPVEKSLDSAYRAWQGGGPAFQGPVL